MAGSYDDPSGSKRRGISKHLHDYQLLKHDWSIHFALNNDDNYEIMIFCGVTCSSRLLMSVRSQTWLTVFTQTRLNR